MKEYCILNCEKMHIFALLFCEVANKMMPKTPMDRKDGEHHIYLSYE